MQFFFFCAGRKRREVLDVTRGRRYCSGAASKGELTRALLSACKLGRTGCLRSERYKISAASFGGMYLPNYTASCNKSKNINSQRRNKQLQVTAFKNEGKLKFKIPRLSRFRKFPCDQGEQVGHCQSILPSGGSSVISLRKRNEETADTLKKSPFGSDVVILWLGGGGGSHSTATPNPSIVHRLVA
jgi:hypothetical protein